MQFEKRYAAAAKRKEWMIQRIGRAPGVVVVEAGRAAPRAAGRPHSSAGCCCVPQCGRGSCGRVPSDFRRRPLWPVAAEHRLQVRVLKDAWAPRVLQAERPKIKGPGGRPLLRSCPRLGAARGQSSAPLLGTPSPPESLPCGLPRLLQTRGLEVGLQHRSSGARRRSPYITLVISSWTL